MNQWFESSLSMLIKRQEFAVEAVKLEWLLKAEVIKVDKDPSSCDEAKKNPFVIEGIKDKRRLYNLIRY